jgi:hypothetical protein
MLLMYIVNTCSFILHYFWMIDENFDKDGD